MENILPPGDERDGEIAAFNPDEWEPHVHRSEVTGQPTGKIELRRKTQGVSAARKQRSRLLGGGKTPDKIPASETAATICEACDLGWELEERDGVWWHESPTGNVGWICRTRSPSDFCFHGYRKGDCSYPSCPYAAPETPK